MAIINNLDDLARALRYSDELSDAVKREDAHAPAGTADDFLKTLESIDDDSIIKAIEDGTTDEWIAAQKAAGGEVRAYADNDLFARTLKYLSDNIKFKDDFNARYLKGEEVSLKELTGRYGINADSPLYTKAVAELGDREGQIDQIAKAMAEIAGGKAEDHKEIAKQAWVQEVQKTRGATPVNDATARHGDDAVASPARSKTGHTDVDGNNNNDIEGDVIPTDSLPEANATPNQKKTDDDIVDAEYTEVPPPGGRGGDGGGNGNGPEGPTPPPFEETHNVASSVSAKQAKLLGKADRPRLFVDTIQDRRTSGWENIFSLELKRTGKMTQEVKSFGSSITDKMASAAEDLQKLADDISSGAIKAEDVPEALAAINSKRSAAASDLVEKTEGMRKSLVEVGAKLDETKPEKMWIYNHVWSRNMPWLGDQATNFVDRITKPQIDALKELNDYSLKQVTDMQRQVAEQSNGISGSLDQISNLIASGKPLDEIAAELKKSAQVLQSSVDDINAAGQANLQDIYRYTNPARQRFREDRQALHRAIFEGYFPDPTERKLKVVIPHNKPDNAEKLVYSIEHFFDPKNPVTGKDINPKSLSERIEKIETLQKKIDKLELKESKKKSGETSSTKLLTLKKDLADLEKGMPERVKFMESVHPKALAQLAFEAYRTGFGHEALYALRYLGYRQGPDFGSWLGTNMKGNMIPESLQTHLKAMYKNAAEADGVSPDYTKDKDFMKFVEAIETRRQSYLHSHSPELAGERSGRRDREQLTERFREGWRFQQGFMLLSPQETWNLWKGPLMGGKWGVYRNLYGYNLDPANLDDYGVQLNPLRSLAKLGTAGLGRKYTYGLTGVTLASYGIEEATELAGWDGLDDKAGWNIGVDPTYLVDGQLWVADKTLGLVSGGIFSLDPDAGLLGLGPVREFWRTGMDGSKNLISGISEIESVSDVGKLFQGSPETQAIKIRGVDMSAHKILKAIEEVDDIEDIGNAHDASKDLLKRSQENVDNASALVASLDSYKTTFERGLQNSINDEEKEKYTQLLAELPERKKVAQDILSNIQTQHGTIGILNDQIQAIPESETTSLTMARQRYVQEIEALKAAGQQRDKIAQIVNDVAAEKLLPASATVIQQQAPVAVAAATLAEAITKSTENVKKSEDNKTATAKLMTELGVQQDSIRTLIKDETNAGGNPKKYTDLLTQSEKLAEKAKKLQTKVVTSDTRVDTFAQELLALKTDQVDDASQTAIANNKLTRQSTKLLEATTAHDQINNMVTTLKQAINNDTTIDPATVTTLTAAAAAPLSSTADDTQADDTQADPNARLQIGGGQPSVTPQGGGTPAPATTYADAGAVAVAAGQISAKNEKEARLPAGQALHNTDKLIKSLEEVIEAKTNTGGDPSALRGVLKDVQTAREGMFGSNAILITQTEQMKTLLDQIKASGSVDAAKADLEKLQELAKNNAGLSKQITDTYVATGKMVDDNPTASEALNSLSSDKAAMQVSHAIDDGKGVWSRTFNDAADGGMGMGTRIASGLKGAWDWVGEKDSQLKRAAHNSGPGAENAYMWGKIGLLGVLTLWGANKVQGLTGMNNTLKWGLVLAGVMYFINQSKNDGETFDNWRESKARTQANRYRVNGAMTEQSSHAATGGGTVAVRRANGTTIQAPLPAKDAGKVVANQDKAAMPQSNVTNLDEYRKQRMAAMQGEVDKWTPKPDKAGAESFECRAVKHGNGNVVDACTYFRIDEKGKYNVTDYKETTPSVIGQN